MSGSSQCKVCKQSFETKLWQQTKQNETRSIADILSFTATEIWPFLLSSQTMKQEPDTEVTDWTLPACREVLNAPTPVLSQSLQANITQNNHKCQLMYTKSVYRHINKIKNLYLKCIRIMTKLERTQRVQTSSNVYVLFCNIKRVDNTEIWLITKTVDIILLTPSKVALIDKNIPGSGCRFRSPPKSNYHFWQGQPQAKISWKHSHNFFTNTAQTNKPRQIHNLLDSSKNHSLTYVTQHRVNKICHTEKHWHQSHRCKTRKQQNSM